ncbi:4-alpha-glucanotransferase [Alkaliphilus metalliredigens QYMF]|uniref:4-alpha-glucanotransferase n=1 Tax=Alkaliphilus metalliredigens (strain QYMF) TaxID=293826 RepID=A6TNT6_ALKMQ|nr:4-alpha-glucanotransferase [Alkaliphilus metalliredigens QYMF]
MERSSGILMHISSLPSPYGIGSFGKEAYEFIDFLSIAGQKYWQILPIGSTGYGDSPYQSFSTFAGNPFFIDLQLLKEEDLLEARDFDNIDFGDNPTKVDYSKIFENKLPVLRKAFENGKIRYGDEVEAFKKENVLWVEDYGLYMALKFHFNSKSWQEWEQDIKLREQEAIHYYKERLKDEIDYWIFLQFLFFIQWNRLKNYANDKGIKIIGDIPIYVAEDSVDAWVNSEIFLFDEYNRPIHVAGCPPDGFSETGQLWGNPLYRWDVLEERGFDWWVERISGSMRLYDVIRVDHFRGLESYWAVPYGEQTAEGGNWLKGPGIKLFHAIEAQLGHVEIIAEDLGFLTPDVIALREQTKYPGMKVLQFAFNIWEESDYLPHNYDKDCVVYTGTHDNDTVMGWLQNGPRDDVAFAKRYLHLNEEEGVHWGFIRGAWSSVGDLAIAQLQDFLGLGSEARMNTPSTLEGNWHWRVKKEALTRELAEKIGGLTKLYGR